jgi:hypothetical protein
VDDEGHGTAVAAIAAGGAVPFFGASKVSMVGVAPSASIQAEKVFNSNGQAFDTDIANGIRRAADNGASVINISGTFSNSATSVAAINYAASKGAFIVYAGGNQVTTFLNGAATTGLTSTAIAHLVFAGSVDTSGVTGTVGSLGAVTLSKTPTLASFSNTPGKGYMADTSGNKVLYSANWLMTPGTNILAPNDAPSIVSRSGTTTFASWSGTSMSAPLVSGSLVLLESAWPILKTNSTAADLLYKTATSLGSSTTFGNGLVNMNKAFLPYGTLMITEANGTKIAATSLTSSMLSSGALGALSSISTKLSAYSSFDSYTRNFVVNLSSVITTNKPITSAVVAAAMPAPSTTGSKLSDGTTLTLSMTDANNPLNAKVLDAPAARQQWFGLASTTKGEVFGLGYGYNYSYVQSASLYGDSVLALNSANLSVANSLTNNATGGSFFAYGSALSENTRIAMTSVSTAKSGVSAFDSGNAWYMPEATGMNLGVVTKLTDSITVGMNAGSLKEEHGLLGSNYSTTSVLNFGNTNKSTSVGLSAGFDLGRGAALLVEASQARVSGSSSSTGLITSVSSLTARSYGMALSQANLITKNDNLTLAVKAPLRVTSGTAQMYTTDVDPVTGVPFGHNVPVNLVPDGRQVDLKLGYSTPVNKVTSMNFNAGYTMDDNNVHGAKSSGVGMSVTLKF